MFVSRSCAGTEPVSPSLPMIAVKLTFSYSDLALSPHIVPFRPGTAYGTAVIHLEQGPLLV